ncbi:MAG: tyrosine--tRNA ligase [Candidatus Niyogibacteria bacterium RIFCSPLOWO2_01_FULL_45_48]|uniref:Tyrosine--tRNA ligase n=2 Tax=Candidatus Niyogiibacteriota TaxID=1817912 RepID=A0A1G2EXF0_9BACT|nr:MAG: tyrosine--tRNA ligase [Candidatus Niyogibacteria bacterium RIFCSPLOWO2_02_FULL_45_13]OGZ30883.1 MAG: tyrosine--tRNA ligase [Candidatus Niyogibacteria bacterium RIFCSPLOWO2_01_FULL_45_48]
MTGFLDSKLNEKISRLSESIITERELEGRLKSGKKLRIKYGVDVTSPFLHLGHAVNLWLMRAFQEGGHKVVFLIGDFTTKIGDPTGRNEKRPRVSDNDIKKSAKEFIKQVSKILLTDKNVFEIRKNSEWYSKMGAGGLVELMSLFTNAQLIERDMFQKRIREGKEVYEHELIYPLLQGYDSVILKSDMTIIGSDQLFNEMRGRDLQEKFGQKPQIIITTKITPGIRGGEKQSKSLGNYIALNDSAREKFGKIMSVPDDLTVQYFEIYSDVALARIEKIKQGVSGGTLNPRDAKMELAEAIALKYHGKKEAEEARNFFVKTFQKRSAPEDAEELAVKNGSTLKDALVAGKLARSNAEAHRLIIDGAVEFDGIAIRNPNEKIKSGGTLRVGKKRFAKIKIK